MDRRKASLNCTTKVHYFTIASHIVAEFCARHGVPPYEASSTLSIFIIRDYGAAISKKRWAQNHESDQLNVDDFPSAN